MSAAAADRRHARTVETAIEARLSLEEERRLDRNEDVARAKANKATRVLLTSLREEAEWDRLGDRERDRAIALVTELCGLLDGIEQLRLVPDEAVGA